MKLFTKIDIDEIGLVKKGGLAKKKSHLGLISMNGEPGWQVDYLGTGTHRINPFFDEIVKVKLTTIPAGEIGLVIANDGRALKNGQILGEEVDCDDFTNPRKFMENGGQIGKQLSILPSKPLKIHTKLFTVVTSENCNEFGLKSDDLREIVIGPNEIGVVNVQIGESLPSDKMVGRSVAGHNDYQNPSKFIENGGFKGWQEQFLQAGNYRINPWFATVQKIQVTEIKQGTVGVVRSKTHTHHLLIALWKMKNQFGTHL